MDRTHHQAVEDEASGEIIHVYAVAGPPVFGGDPKAWDFNVQFPLWGVTFILQGTIDLSSLIINATFLAEIPLVGPVTLAAVDGNLKSGITVTYGSVIISVTAKFYAQNGYLYVDLSATIFGTKHGPITIKLIPIPA